jgi:hypothetical protein
MHKTLYVDIDEEITNVLDRIKEEPVQEIFLVIPKGALLIQGVINLKILKREVLKFGKDLSIITNDQQAKKVVRQLGLKVRDKVDSSILKPQDRESQEQALSSRATEEVYQQLGGEGEVNQGGMADTEVSGESIGSSGFFDYEPRSPQENSSQPESSPQPKRKAPTPPQKKVDSSSKSPTPANKGKTFLPASAKATLKKIPYPKIPGFKRVPFKESQNSLVAQRQAEISQKASDFFAHQESKEEQREGRPTSDPRKKTNPPQEKSGFWGKWLAIILVGVVGLGGLGYWVYANYPKVTVQVYPQFQVVSEELQLLAKEDLSEGDKLVIPGSYRELTVSHSQEFSATGESFADHDGKARGKVTISNHHSQENQPLVATTRLLSEEGKLFRLEEGVVVPGMEGEEPGRVTASVVADESGAEYNIGPTTFTIEGFKSNPPKYENFKVTSSSPMTSGGDPQERKRMAQITENDLEKAQEKTQKELQNNLEEKLDTQLDRGQEVLLESIEIISNQEQSSRDTGDLSDKFTYTIQQKIRLIAFSESKLREVALERLSREASLGYQLAEESFKISYQRVVPDFNKQSLELRVKAEAKSWPELEFEVIKKGVAEKSAQEIEQFLSDYPGIRRAEVVFEPSWLAGIPVTEKKIEVKEHREVINSKAEN